MKRDFHIDTCNVLREGSKATRITLCLFTLSGSAAAMLFRFSGWDIGGLISSHAVLLAFAIISFAVILGFSVLGTCLIPVCCVAFGVLMTVCSASIRQYGAAGSDVLMLYLVFSPTFLLAAEQGMYFSHSITLYAAANSSYYKKRNRFLLLSCACLLAPLALLYVMTRYVF